MFVEKPMIQNSEADPFEISDANTMYEYLQNELKSKYVELTYN